MKYLANIELRFITFFYYPIISSVCNYQDNHSAVTITTLNYFISSWGERPLVGSHNYSYCPLWHIGTTFTYYKRTNNPAIFPTFESLFHYNNLITTPVIKLKNGVYNVNKK